MEIETRCIYLNKINEKITSLTKSIEATKLRFKKVYITKEDKNTAEYFMRKRDLKVRQEKLKALKIFKKQGDFENFEKKIEEIMFYGCEQVN